MRLSPQSLQCSVDMVQPSSLSKIITAHAYRKLAIIRWLEKKKRIKLARSISASINTKESNVVSPTTASPRNKLTDPLGLLDVRKKVRTPFYSNQPVHSFPLSQNIQLLEPNTASVVCPSVPQLEACYAFEHCQFPHGTLPSSQVLPEALSFSAPSNPNCSAYAHSNTHVAAHTPGPVVSVHCPVPISKKRVHRKKNKMAIHDLSTTDALSNVPISADILPATSNCGSCGAVRFFHEPPSFCCSGGDIVLVSTPLPSILTDLLTSGSDESKSFRSCIRTYNNHLAFTSLDATYDKDLSRRNKGIYTFRVQGQVYHFMPPLFGEGDSTKNLQFYLHDTEHELAHRLLGCPRLYEISLQKILLVLEENPYSRFFRSLRTEPNLEEHAVLLYCNPDVDQRVYNKPSVNQVAGILVDGTENHHRSIRIYTLAGHPHTIQYYYGCYDPLQYPLLFPYGQLGWHQGILKQGVAKKGRKRGTYEDSSAVLNPACASDAQNLLHHEEQILNASIDNFNSVSVREYYCYRFQIRPSDQSYLLHFGRLFQQYAVDMFVKLETQRLDYFKSQQVNIRQEFRQGLADAFATGEHSCGKVGQRVVLPATFIGGPRHMRKKYLDAMSLVKKFGKPDIFITMTSNPNWPEIKEHLKYNEQSQDRPDIVCRVFRAKLEELKNELFKNNVFGEVAAYTYVIEYQKRGLPHVHILLILKPQSKIYRPEEFDMFVCAEIPDKLKHPHLHKLVLKHMLHGPCGDHNPTNICMKKNATCKDFYPRAFCDETCIADDAYPIYRRRNNGVREKVRGVWLDNRWVVPYNPYLLAKFDCHMNVEICSTIKAIKYIYKYICKGSDRILFNVSNQNQHDPASNSCHQSNEIEQYQSGRWISAPESLWRMFKFPITEIKPPVIQMHVHLENYQPVTFKHKELLSSVLNSPLNQRTMLTEFFYMNKTSSDAKARNCSYSEFPNHFVCLVEQKKMETSSKGEFNW